MHTDAFTRIARFWRFLAAERESGRLHGFEEHASIRPKGSVAEVCLACPIPGFNTPVVDGIESESEHADEYVMFFPRLSWDLMKWRQDESESESERADEYVMVFHRFLFHVI